MEKVEVLSATKQRFRGETFYLCGAYYQHKGRRLHRVVWEAFHGAVPDGCHIHHIDGDKAHNDIDNLACLNPSEHERYHGHTEERQQYGRMHIERIRPLASRWHGSEEGKAWHSARGKANWALREERVYTCTQCGREFRTKYIYGAGKNHFCGQNCRAKYGRRKRAGGIDSAGGH